jgi:hypothetical protein
LICGGRYTDSKQVCRWLESKFINCFPEATEIIHGNAPGADTGADWFCRRNGFPVRVFPAQWEEHGKKAGPIRNAQMLRELKLSRDDRVLAFPGFRGTAHMKSIARKAGFQVHEIDIEELNSV